MALIKAGIRVFLNDPYWPLWLIHLAVIGLCTGNYFNSLKGLEWEVCQLNSQESLAALVALVNAGMWLDADDNIDEENDDD